MRGRGIELTLVFTGQHPLEPAEYGLNDYSAVRLDCTGGGDPHAHAADVTAAMLPVLDGTRLLIVQGDTSSALGAARAAAIARVAVAHVEAGLRSHDRQRPWPEEDFRVAIDRLAQLLFAPTELNAANLRRERLAGSIFVTGNSGIDAVVAMQQRPRPALTTAQLKPKLLVTCHRRESWGMGLAGIAGALRSIAEQEIATVDLLLHPNPATAAHLRALLLGCDGVALHPPLGHRETIAAMVEADCVLSDSGGMQEECAALGIPLLVLRERTERPEAIACGRMTLVGTEGARIIEAVQGIVQRPRTSSAQAYGEPYGDGFAGERIAAHVDDWLQTEAARPGAVRLLIDTAAAHPLAQRRLIEAPELARMERVALALEQQQRLDADAQMLADGAVVKGVGLAR